MHGVTLATSPRVSRGTTCLSLFDLQSSAEIFQKGDNDCLMSYGGGSVEEDTFKKMLDMV